MVNESKMIGWGKLIAAMFGFGVVVGVMFGLLGSAGLLPTVAVPAIVGVICGVAAPLLMLRMRHTHQR